MEHLKGFLVPYSETMTRVALESCFTCSQAEPPGHKGQAAAGQGTTLMKGSREWS